MKKNSLLMIAAMVLMTACGTMAQQSVTSTASRFEDGIYSSGPSFRSKVERQELRQQMKKTAERPWTVLRRSGRISIHEP